MGGGTCGGEAIVAVDPEAEVKCAYCGKGLGYPNKISIDARPHPVDCGGDLCDACEKIIYQGR